jgi:hypothetical protein
VNVGARLQHLVLAAYPPSFRHRYGDELAALVADGGRGGRDTVDLVLGAARAWASPVFGGDPGEQRRTRLQASTITVLAAWCASLVGAAGFSKSVDDPRLPGLHGAAWTAYDIGVVVLEITAAVVLVTGFVYWLGVIVPALRARRRDIVVPAAAPALFVVVWLGITGLVGLFARHVVPTGQTPLTWPRGALILAVLVGWALLTLACVVGCAGSATVALRRASLSAHRLAGSTVVAGLAVVGVAVQMVAGAVCLAGLLRAGGGLGPRDTVFSSGCLAVLAMATAVASVSAARGLRVLRPAT